MLAEIMAGFFCYFLKCDRNFSTKIYLHKSWYAVITAPTVGDDEVSGECWQLVLAIHVKGLVFC
jgi:hypothetical protein